MTAGLWVIIAAVALLAYANGANDNFKAVATLYGSRTLGYRRALAWATVAQLGGSFMAVALAQRLAVTFSGKGLVDAGLVGEPTFLLPVGLGAAAVVMVATRLGLPVSTTHALTGALVGSGLVMSNTGVHLSVLGGTFFLPLLITPFLALAAATLVYPCASKARRIMGIGETTCLCIGPRPIPVAVDPSGRFSGSASVGRMRVGPQCRGGGGHTVTSSKRFSVRGGR